jgi:hypothetical protein
VITDSHTASEAKFGPLGIDLSYKLFITRGGSVKVEHQLGRVWQMHYPAVFRFLEGPARMVQRLELAPAYAGFKHGIVDRAALAALAAVASTFSQRATTETLPGDTRAAVSRLLGRPIELTRLLFRIATLYSTAAIAEATGKGLNLATLNDDVSPRTISTFSDFATSLEATSRTGEQPIYIGLKSLSEPEIYARIVRILALNHPKFTTTDLEAAPTVAQLWPEIPGARAYVFGATDTYPGLSGAVTARDVALYAEHFCRLYDVRSEYESILQLVLSFTTRPAGSGALGATQQVIFALPPASHSPLVLTPLTQATDVLGDEQPTMGLLYPAPLLLQAAARAAVFLTASHLTLQQAGGYWLGQPGPPDRSLLANYKQYITMRYGGSGAAHSALRMTEGLGWQRAYSDAWPLFTPASAPNGCLFPVEAEECLPFIDAIPATSALLALLKPVSVDALVPAGQLLTPLNVKGRQSLTDAHYSVIGLRNPATLHGMRTPRGSPFAMRRPIQVHESYRRQPSDGQFGTVQLETHTLSVAFTFNTPESILESHLLKEKHANAEILYFWNVPHTDPTTLAQYVEDGFVPPQESHLPVEAPQAQEQTTVRPPPSAYFNKPEAVRPKLEELRDVLGADYGAILDAHAEMSSLAGRQLPDATYEAKSRSLTGLLTAFQVDMVPFMIEDPLAVRTFLTWAKAACEDAREWDYRPTSKDQLTQQQAIVDGLLEATPAEDCPPTPPLPPTHAQLEAAKTTVPFTEEQPDPGREEASVRTAGAGTIQPAAPPTAEDFQLEKEPVQQTPARVATPPTVGGLVVQSIGFTAPE